MKKNKIAIGSIGIIFGYLIFALIIHFVSKPENEVIKLQPIESIKIYFFALVYSMGNLGWLIGILLLLGYIALCYIIAIWIFRQLR
ncbi:hypothetical protein C7377_0241 [Balneicella halophila]|uniref:Uncharacterized protein n=1 Tax=Balneicella halophila TaxID=1537566 RepID=A0A7L4URV2_BALHA|nr:hypothetical protein [Balneicella halophila]PVX51947.1 hypothetical protein C7377_0241 [Balneicella halophila]